MGFLKKHVEKVLFAALLVGLVLSVLLVIQMTASLRITQATPLVPIKPNLEQNTAEVDALLASLTTDHPVLAVTTNSFTSSARKKCINPDDLSLIPIDATLCPYCGVKQTLAEPDSDGDGIIDRLERLWGLNPNDPTDAIKDLDGDGFPTLFEHQKGTDPLDATSHPALVDFLRLDGVVAQRMNLELRGVAQLTENVYTLQLRWQYPGENNWESGFVRTGSTFGRNKELVAEKFTDKFTQKGDVRVDESFATIRSGRHTISLQRTGDKRTGSIVESTATIKLVFGPEWKQDVRMGQSFELDKISYKVIDIREGAVVIQADSAEPLTLAAPTAEELNALKPIVPLEGAQPDDMGFDPNLF